MMPRRPDGLDRDALREKLLAVAEALVVQGGAQALTARALATHIGYSLGHIYNLVNSLQDLRTLLAERAVTRLEEAVAEALDGQSGPARLKTLAQVFIKYCRAHPALWQLAEAEVGGGAGAGPAALVSLLAAELKLRQPRLPAAQLQEHSIRLCASLCGLALLERSGVIAPDHIKAEKLLQLPERSKSADTKS